MKKYIAKTNVSINVVLPTGANRHIAFSALTGGGSVFYTDDPDIQKAMECHYKFGKLFRVDHKYIPEKQRNKPAPKPKTEIVPEQPTVSAAPIPIGEAQTPTVEEVEYAPAGETTVAVPDSEQPTAEDIDSDGQPEEAEDNETEAEDNGLKTIVVSDPDAAKAYLAEHFGISRTKIKSVKAIKEAAAAHGIVFEGI